MRLFRTEFTGEIQPDGSDGAKAAELRNGRP